MYIYRTLLKYYQWIKEGVESHNFLKQWNNHNYFTRNFPTYGTRFWQIELNMHARTHFILKKYYNMCPILRRELPSTVVEITLTSDNSIWKSKWHVHWSVRLTYGFKCIIIWPSDLLKWNKQTILVKYQTHEIKWF